MNHLATPVRNLREKGLLLPILLLALVLRLIALGERPVWYDEAFAVLYAGKSFGAILYGTIAPVQGVAADVHPLLYYFSLHLWMDLCGESPFAVRLPSALLGVATVVLAFCLARSLFATGAGNGQFGLLASFLVALSPFHVAYSQEARMYSLLAFLSLLATLFFVKGCRERKYSDWLGFTLAGALSLYTHNLAFLPLLTIALWVVAARRWDLIAPLAISCLAMALIFAPWLALLPSQFGKIQQAYWVPRPGLAELVRTLIVFNFNLPLPNWFLPVALFFSLLLLAFILYEAWHRMRNEVPAPGLEHPLLFILGLAFVPLITMFLISQLKSIYIERGLLPAGVAYSIVLAWFFSRSNLPRPIRVGLLVVWCVLAVASLGYNYQYAGFPRPPFQKVAAYLRANYRPGDAIVHDNKLTFFPTHYYDRSLPQSFVADPPGSGSDTLALPTQQVLGLYATSLREATTGHQRVWFVIFRQAIEEYRQAGYVEHPDVAWLEGHYHQSSVTHFNDLDVYLYEQ
jgi:mannosyltransferase